MASPEVRIRTDQGRISRWLAVAVILLAWGLRLCYLEDVPPGWRDDELIDIHVLSGEVLEGRFPLYFSGASGHEPLYHYLHAGVHALWGFNVLSGHILSVACGTLTVALTFALARRLFGDTVAVLASLGVAMSMWSLMYSRMGLRHAGLPPLALLTLDMLWRKGTGYRQGVWAGIALTASLYTYTAARLLPVLIILFGLYLVLFHRERSGSFWRRALIALVLAGVLTLPMAIAIAQGRSEAAIRGIGADARLDELALPIHELRKGNPRPLLEYTLTTLGMFHATGDPEWLYNISNRPVFHPLSAALFWAGVAVSLYRWRQSRYFFALLWLGLGLLPAFLSIPAASLGHTIVAMPVVYMLVALVLSVLAGDKPGGAGRRLWGLMRWGLVGLLIGVNAFRDLRDYFVVWPAADMVRFLYRADYRAASRYLDAHHGITDIAIGSGLMGPWDRLALQVDTQREDIAIRLFNPTRALVWTGSAEAALVLLTSWPQPSPEIAAFLVPDEATSSLPLGLRLFRTATPPPSNLQPVHFSNGLTLLAVHPVPADEGRAFLSTWRVDRPLDLPPMPIIAHPPPPGVYSGPRLVIFTHLLSAEGNFIAGDDWLWVDPLTLQPGDIFVQLHRLIPPSDAPAAHTFELGLYDPCLLYTS
ncbi:MAG: glycosyltransferase family 39 protein, partial [Anaerolineae bacterium]|nr:glycosyltransferase family 39 protein [Anaerolineae bacterium]